MNNWITGLWQPKAEHTPALAGFLHMTREDVRRLRRTSGPKQKDQIKEIERRLTRIENLLEQLATPPKRK